MKPTGWLQYLSNSNMPYCTAQQSNLNRSHQLIEAAPVNGCEQRFQKMSAMQALQSATETNPSTFRGSRATSKFSPVLLGQQVFKVSTFGLCPQRGHSHIQLQQEWSKHLSQWLKKSILTHVSPIDLTRFPCCDHSLKIVHPCCGETCFSLAH